MKKRHTLATNRPIRCSTDATINESFDAHTKLLASPEVPQMCMLTPFEPATEKSIGVVFNSWPDKLYELDPIRT